MLMSSIRNSITGMWAGSMSILFSLTKRMKCWAVTGMRNWSSCIPGGATQENFKKISAVNFITENDPPTLYMTCTGDFLKAQAPMLEDKLLEKDIPHEFHYFGNSGETLGHVFHLNMKSERAAECNDVECGFFRRFI